MELFVLLGLAVWVVLLFPLVEFERTGFAALTILVGLGALHYVFGYDVFGTVLHNPLAVVVGLVAYTLVGVGYSLLRWNWYCGAWRRDYDAADTHMQARLWYSKPAAKDSKNRITTWMMFWPWSALWWFLSDFITEVFDRIYTSFAKVYQRIAERHLKGLTEPDTK